MILTAHIISAGAVGAFLALIGALLVVDVKSLGLQATRARRIAARPSETVATNRMIMALGVRSGIALRAAACVGLSPVRSLALHLDSIATAVLSARPPTCRPTWAHGRACPGCAGAGEISRWCNRFKASAT